MAETKHYNIPIPDITEPAEMEQYLDNIMQRIDWIMHQIDLGVGCVPENIKQEFTRLRCEHLAMMSELRRMNCIVSADQKSVGDMLLQVKSVVVRLDKLRQEYDEFQDKTEENVKRIDEKNTEQDERLDGIDEKDKEQDEKLDEHGERITTLENNQQDITDLQAQADQNSSDIANIKSEQQTQNTDITNLSNRVTLNRQDIDGITEFNNLQVITNNGFRQNIQQINDILSGLESRQDYGTDVSDLKRRVSDAEAELNKSTTAILQIGNTAQENSGKLGVLEGLIPTMQESINTNKENISKHNTIIINNKERSEKNAGQISLLNAGAFYTSADGTHYSDLNISGNITLSITRNPRVYAKGNSGAYVTATLDWTGTTVNSILKNPKGILLPNISQIYGLSISSYTTLSNTSIVSAINSITNLPENTSGVLEIKLGESSSSYFNITCGRDAPEYVQNLRRYPVNRFFLTACESGTSVWLPNVNSDYASLSVQARAVQYTGVTLFVLFNPSTLLVPFEKEDSNIIFSEFRLCTDIL